MTTMQIPSWPRVDPRDYADMQAVELQGECYRLIAERDALAAALRRIADVTKPASDWTDPQIEAHQIARAALAKVTP